MTLKRLDEQQSSMRIPLENNLHVETLLVFDTANQVIRRLTKEEEKEQDATTRISTISTNRLSPPMAFSGVIGQN